MLEIILKKNRTIVRITNYLCLCELILEIGTGWQQHFF